MSPGVRWAAIAIGVVGLGVALYLMWGGSSETPPVTGLRESSEPPLFERDDEAPRVRHPVPGKPASEASELPPLPPLNESDAAVQDSLANMVGRKLVNEFLVPTNIIRRMVATVDNLPNAKLAVRMRPVMPTEGKFAVAGTDDDLTLDEANFARYTPFVKAVQSVDTRQLAEAYFHFYPLFQQAYEDLGYPGRYFNDRMVEVIDHLLETPQVQGPIRLKQPRVMYEYADPQLEQLSAGQKLLIRMGGENASVIKQKLRELRQEIAGQELAQP